MEKQNNFNVLSEQLKCLVKKENYSITTIKNMNFVLNLFSNYMAENKLTKYTPEIGVAFANYCDKELHICQSRVSLARKKRVN